MNRPVARRGGPNFTTHDDDEGESGGYGLVGNFPDCGAMSTEEEEDYLPDTMKAAFGATSDDVVQLNKIAYNKTIIGELVQKVSLRRLNEIINKKIFKFRTAKFFSFVKIKKKVFIEKIQSFGGDFCQYEDDIMTILKDDYLYIIRVEARQDLVITFLTVYASSQEALDSSLKVFSDTFSEYQGEEELYCELCWLIQSDGRTEEKFVREKLDDVIYKEAYPYIDVDNIIDSYLKGDEPILIFTGVPGTGKTRLIRYILKKISLRKRGDDVTRGYDDSVCKVMYTCSAAIIEEGKLFIEFLTEDHDVLVLEDIDNHLRPRTDGNTAMYGLLSSSNGLIVSTINSKKIILSTNLPGIDKIDDALIRPGRCFNIIQTRKLSWEEAKNFLKASDNEDKQLPEDKEEFALSELYHLIKYSTTETKYLKKKRVGF